MITYLGTVYAFLLGWPLAARLHRVLFYLSGRALGLNNYSSLAVSGELKVIAQALRALPSPVVFDVGANEGNWLATVLKHAPGSSIHAFEPQPQLALRIAERGFGGVTVNNVAVGDGEGTLDLFDYDRHSGSSHASLLRGVIEGVHGGKARSTQVPVIKLDHYCHECGISHIDLLKVDVEGYELKVLSGAARMISERRIAAIQFEFNEMNIVGRTFLADFFALLGTQYRIYRILPHGLLPLASRDHWQNEQYVYQNILALLQPIVA